MRKKQIYILGSIVFRYHRCLPYLWCVNANKINLNSIVLSIVEQLEDLDSLELFRARMESKGYRWNPEYDNYNFSYKGHHFYSIEEGFPALTRTDVSEAIGNVEYTVILTSISQFMED